MKKLLTILLLALISCFMVGCQDKAAMAELEDVDALPGFIFSEPAPNSDEVTKIFCFVSAKFGPHMIFLKRWFAYNKITQGDMHEYEKEARA